MTIKLKVAIYISTVYFSTPVWIYVNIDFSQRRNPHLQSVVTGIKLGDLASVSRLLASGLVPVNSTHKGASLLCLAVSSNNPDMV